LAIVSEDLRMTAKLQVQESKGEQSLNAKRQQRGICPTGQ